MFDSQAEVFSAMENLKDARFDPDSPLTLRVELAKQNSYPKRTRAPDEAASQPSKAFRRDAYPPHQAMHQALPSPGISQPYNFAPAPLYGQPYGFNPPLDPFAPPHDLGFFPPPAYHPIEHFKQLPANACSTIFVTGLNIGTTEAGLNEIFGRLPGFVKLKMSKETGDRPPVAWVEFSDAKFSATVLDTLSSVAPGMRGEFAKAKMGSTKRSDAGNGGA
ncbi:hypothetical protein CYMTET_42248 [Cymbomonas tetramitiformis]|uniref:RRM domain-containing protein n=1 Tax=Cymbomonas tetramitiformis TaxID=36881 RepID=A0AAE0C4I8_9CHLO|nr:hypothetical protein CYMTET_42248 [Cymbomonas tetramitiformis]